MEEGLHEAVLDLDEKNMGAQLASMGEDFDRDLRQASFYHPRQVFILVWDGSWEPERMVAYFQYGPMEEDPHILWVHSVQIDFDYRGGPMLARMIAAACLLLQKSDFKKIAFAIHKVHDKAMGVYKRLGFRVHKDDYSMFSFIVEGGVEIFQARTLKKLIKRYGRKNA